MRYIPMPTLLAHGALGAFDEILLLAVGIGFVAMMVFSWIKSRNMEFDEPESTTDPSPDSPSTNSDTSDHIKLQ